MSGRTSRCLGDLGRNEEIFMEGCVKLIQKKNMRRGAGQKVVKNVEHSSELVMISA